MAKGASQRTRLGLELYLDASERLLEYMPRALGLGLCYIDIIRADMQAIALAASLRPS